jgi:hypothetical protein
LPKTHYPPKSDPGVGDPAQGDLMAGVPRITAFLRVLFDDPSLPEGRIYHWISKGYIPAGNMGHLIIASKTQIREHLAKPTNLSAAND